MDYHVGDIVEFNFNGCLWSDYPSVKCEIMETKPNSAGVFRLKLPKEADPMWENRLAMESEDTFVCHRDWFRLAAGKPVSVDVSDLL